MVKKKPPPAKPYDPYNPYGSHSLPWFQQQANQRAAGDTTAAVAALPSAAFYTDSAAQLAKALQGIQGQQSQVAAAGTPLYQQAFDSASGAANKAAMTGGGTGVQATPGGGSLVGALGATMAQALSGGQSAAVARGRNDVLARAGQESAIRAKQPGAAAAYLKEMTDTALQARVAQFNQQLAQSQFGLNASNIATDNTIAQQNADTSAARAAAAASASANTAAARTSAADQKLKDKKIAGVQARLEAWTKPTKRPSGQNIYTFAPPGVAAFEVTAKDGPGALALAMQHLTAQGVTGLTGTQVGGYLKSTKQVLADKAQKTNRDAYKIALRQLSGPGGVFSKKEAQRWLRDYFGVSQTGPLQL